MNIQMIIYLLEINQDIFKKHKNKNKNKHKKNKKNKKIKKMNIHQII